MAALGRPDLFNPSHLPIDIGGRGLALWTIPVLLGLREENAPAHGPGVPVPIVYVFVNIGEGGPWPIFVEYGQNTSKTRNTDHCPCHGPGHLGPLHDQIGPYLSRTLG